MRDVQHFANKVRYCSNGVDAWNGFPRELYRWERCCWLLGLVNFENESVMGSIPHHSISSARIGVNSL